MRLNEIFLVAARRVDLEVVGVRGIEPPAS